MAFELVETMIQKGLKRTQETNINVLRIHARHGDIDKVLFGIERLKSENNSLQDKDILQLICDLAVNDHQAKCKHLFGLLTKDEHYIRLVANTVNCLLRKNKDNVAYNLLKTVPAQVPESKEFTSTVESFLTQLVKAGRPAEQMIRVCQRLIDDGLHLNPFQVLNQKLSESGLGDNVWMILQRMRDDGIKLVADDFQPVFVNSSNVAEVIQNLRVMREKFSIRPAVKFLGAMALSNINVEQPDAIINTLMLSDDILSRKSAALAVAYRCLQQSQLKHAADILTFFGFYVQISVFQPVLISAFKNTLDVDNYVRFLRAQYDNLAHRPWLSVDQLSKIESIDQTSGSIDDESRFEFVGKILYNTLDDLKEKHRAGALTAILQGLVDQGIHISRKQAERIEITMGSAITSEIVSLLHRLASGELVLKITERPKLKIMPASREKHIPEYEMAPYKGKNEIVNKFVKNLQNDPLPDQRDDGERKGASSVPCYTTVNEFLKQVDQQNASETRKAYYQLSKVDLAAAINKISIASADRTLFYLFEALADDGDVEGVEEVNSMMPKATQCGVWYRDNRAKACAISAQVDQWINEWDQKLVQAVADNELETLENTFTIHGFYIILEKNPKRLSECKRFDFPYILNQ